jgi:predicted secreted protein
MKRTVARLIGVHLLALGWALPAAAQTPAAAPARFEGSLVQISGTAEIDVVNDEAVATFFAEVQEADLARAQSQVNQRVGDALAALKKADPKGQVSAGGYSTFPVYGRDGSRTVVAWRVRQTVVLRTADLAQLPRTVAAAQKQLALGGLEFRLSRAARERVDSELIQRALASLNARVAAAAQALSIPPARIRIEELNFGVVPFERPPVVAFARAAPLAAEAVAEPSFEAGTSTQQMTVTAKVRFLAP